MCFGDGTAPEVAIRLADEAALWSLLLDPELKVGELYMDERLVTESGSIYDLLELLLRNANGARSFFPVHPIGGYRALKWRFKVPNTAARAKRNVSHHYDLDSGLYELFLDADRQYSCAYFEHPDQTIDEAQVAKKRHIAAKLRLEPGQRVLDIGSGWGGLAMFIAEIEPTTEVLGITLSEEQLTYARERVARAGLGSRVRFELLDYRAVRGTFDRIVSVGMFEHVGPSAYDAFFGACRRLLAADGVMLLHSIARTGEPSPPHPWINRYIFPGGHIPTLSEIAPPLERSGLMLADLEVLRLHYAWTLRAWRERFLAGRERAVKIYGERFCRMWEFYLAGCEAAFRFEDLLVFQIQLAKHNQALPVRRDYMTHAEDTQRQRDSGPAPGPCQATREDATR